MGVWIETKRIYARFYVNNVTPCVGVWIETTIIADPPVYNVSHPAWVCGLKLRDSNH